MYHKYEVDFLLIEDDHEEAELTIRSLKRNNLVNKIIHIDDGADALEFLFSEGRFEGQPKNHPRMVLLDLNLPRVGGLEILRRIKSHNDTCTIPVVVLTSSAEERDIIESYKLGVNSYIVKPVNFESFSKAIEEMKMYWMVLNQGPPYPKP
jgi:DNA-binding response OmpR family regulator